MKTDQRERSVEHGLYYQAVTYMCSTSPQTNLKGHLLWAHFIGEEVEAPKS